MITNTAQARKITAAPFKNPEWNATSEPGLFVRVKKKKSYWSVKKMVNGKRLFAQWDINELSFKEAKLKYAKMIIDLENGVDLTSQKIKKERIAKTTSNTLKKFADQWLAEKAKRVSKKQLEEDTRSIKKIERWHERNPKAIERSEFADLYIELFEKTGKPQVKLQKSLSNFYNYLVKKRGVCDYNPVPDAPEQYKPRTRVLRRKDLRQIYNYDFKTGTRHPEDRWSLVYQMMIRCGGLRLGAVLGGKFEEIITHAIGDKTYNVWVVPFERMKRHPGDETAHYVPLVPEIENLITKIRGGRNSDNGFFFPKAISRKEGTFEYSKAMTHPTKKKMDEWRTALNITGDFAHFDRENSVDPLDLKLSTDIRSTMTTQIIRDACGYTGDEPALVQGRIAGKKQGAEKHYDFSQQIEKKFEVLTNINKHVDRIIADPI